MLKLDRQRRLLGWLQLLMGAVLLEQNRIFETEVGCPVKTYLFQQTALGS